MSLYERNDPCSFTGTTKKEQAWRSVGGLLWWIDNLVVDGCS